MIWELVKEKDEEILKHLKHVDTERTDKPEKTLSVTFFFTPNDYFSNESISLKIFYK